jgi:predicted ArsR family transcriptional regulator
MADDLAQQVEGIGALAEPARRSLYLYVAAQPDAVSREQAARAVDLPLHSAKFHLDRLVDEGLLDVEFRRLSGRTGPGAGRPSKLYRRSARQLAVSIPERRYDLAGDVLASAIDRATTNATPVRDAVRQVALEEGRRIAAEALAGAAEPDAARGARGSAGLDGLARTAEVLAEHGYEPRLSESEICLANCPFDRLAAEHTDLVCDMNLALIDGVLHGLRAQGLAAELAPQAGFCCVKVRGDAEAEQTGPPDEE